MASSWGSWLMSFPCDIALNMSLVFQGNFCNSTKRLYESIQTNSSAEATVVLAVSSPGMEGKFFVDLPPLKGNKICHKFNEL